MHAIYILFIVYSCDIFFYFMWTFTLSYHVIATRVHESYIIVDSYVDINKFYEKKECKNKDESNKMRMTNPWSVIKWKERKSTTIEYPTSNTETAIKSPSNQEQITHVYTTNRSLTRYIYRPPPSYLLLLDSKKCKCVWVF